MKTRSIIGCIIASMSTVAIGLVGIAASATPAAAATPTCRTEPYTPGFGTGARVTAYGSGVVNCSQSLRLVKIELQLVADYGTGRWLEAGADMKHAEYTTSVWWKVEGPCKGTENVAFATKARGGGLYQMTNNPQPRMIDDPSDNSYRWSNVTTLDCGSRPEAPSKDDICRTVSASPRSATTGTRRTSDGGGVIPVC